MKHFILTAACLLFLFTCASAQKTEVAPNTDKLAAKFIEKDSALFNAIFNTCNVQEIEKILAADFVFYQNQADSNTTHAQTLDEFIDHIKKHYCNKTPAPKVHRELVKGSTQVFTAGKQKALQTGTQRLYIKEQNGKDSLVEESRFSREWQWQNGDWKIKQEMDMVLHTKPATAKRYVSEEYVPENKALYDTIALLDSLYFETYNTCDTTTMKSMMADSLEFYHDRSGLETSKARFIEAIKKNICGKVTRQLVQNSIEVYPINGFGAVEMGYHRFINHAEGNSVSKPDKFIIIWKKMPSGWQMTRIVSLH